MARFLRDAWYMAGWSSELGNKPLSRRIFDRQLALFRQAFDEEDKPMIRASFENLEGQDFWEAKPVSLGVDAGGLRVRRRLKAMLAGEDPE
jgi:vanillate O-demethylase monooxygenase subunit